MSSPSGMASTSSSLKSSPFCLNSSFACSRLHHLARERRVAGDDLAHLGFDLGQIVGRERLVAREVVIEAVVDHRTDRDLRAGIELLHGLRHDMRRVMADQLERFGIVARQELDRGVIVDGRFEVGELAVEAHRHRALGERRRDRLGDVQPGKCRRAPRAWRHREMSGRFQTCHFSSHSCVPAQVRDRLSAGVLARFQPAVTRPAPTAVAPRREGMMLAAQVGHRIETVAAPRMATAEPGSVRANRPSMRRSSRSPRAHNPSRSANAGN